MRNVDAIIVDLLENGRLRVDLETGEVFAPKSNTPGKPIGTVTAKGYLRACVTVGGRQVHVMLHRVVWIAAHGVPPDGFEIDHGPRGKSVNRPDNLDAVPGLENIRRAKAAGLLRPVKHARHYNARLTDAQVTHLRSGRATKTTKELAAEFGVSESHVRRIVTGKRWSNSVQERPNG